MKNTWKEYFAFNKKQRNGILVLISFIAILVLYLFFANYFTPSLKPVDFSPLKAELEKAGIKSSVKNNTLIDINSADTGLLMTLPKMTSYCAEMIVNYRKKLGGYYSKKQLTEVWGMDTSIFQSMVNKVQIDTGLVHKININTATMMQLAYHPYIKYYLAKAIVNYRVQHGLFSSLSELRQIVAIDDSTYKKIIPYLTAESKKN